MERINWKRLLLIAGLLLLLALILRGCVFACSAGGGQTQQGGVKTEKTVSVYLKQTGQIVNMPLETYLVGVVAAEMPASFHVEALKAQAVAARTFTYRRIKDGGLVNGAQLSSDSNVCQAYNTDAECRKKWGEGYAANIAKVRGAVKATEDEVMVYGGELIDALYHACSGGRTEDSENVFVSALPYLRSVSSSDEVGSSHETDEVRMTRAEFAAAVNKNWPQAKLKASTLEKQVKVENRFTSGRVETVKLGGATATGRELRGALELYSAWFTLSYTKNEVVIDTRGYGHGVGMSQAGANGLAQEGETYKQILTHYYTGVSLQKADGV